MEKLSGLSSLQAVCHKFSDGVDVVKCVSGFIKEVGDTEQSYSTCLEKLVKSPLYNFHSNFLTQFLGSTPYQEIGTVKHTWEKLGEELNILARLHAEKAVAYQESVRKPLIELMPLLEEKRKEFRNRARQLRADLDTAEARHLKERTLYHKMSENLDRNQAKVDTAKAHGASGPKAYLTLKTEGKQEVKRAELNIQEGVYKEAHKKHIEATENFNKEAIVLLKDVQELECERVDRVKNCLMDFTSILSNTAPVYLESMQRMTLSVEEISAVGDIQMFVKQRQQMEDKEAGTVPELDLRPNSQNSPTSPRRHLADDVVDDNDDTPEPAKVQETEEHKMEDTLVREPPSTQTVVKGPREEKVGVVRNGNPQPAAHPLQPEAPSRSVYRVSTHPTSVTGVGVADAQKPLSKPRKKPPLQAKPSHADTSQPNEEATPHYHTQTLPRLHRLPNGHSHKSGGGTAARTPGNRSTSTATLKKSPNSPKTSPKMNKKRVVSSSADHQSNQSPSLSRHKGPTPISQRPNGRSSSSQPIGYSPFPSQTNGHSSGSPQQPNGTTPTSQPRSSSSSSRAPREGPITKKQEEVEQLEVRLLGKLSVKAHSNDYYRMLGVEPGCSHDDLAKARREKSRELHPDHCANDEQQRIRNEQKLTLINQAYQNVLQNESTRENYNVLCAFRKRYSHILQQDFRKLKVAETKLVELRKKMKKSHMPESLLQEVDCALTLIQTRLVAQEQHSEYRPPV